MIWTVIIELSFRIKIRSKESKPLGAEKVATFYKDVKKYFSHEDAV